MYIAVTKHKNNFLKIIACNFKLLEERCLEYNTEKIVCVFEYINFRCYFCSKNRAYNKRTTRNKKRSRKM